MQRIYIKKDMVSAMFDKARPVLIHNNKDYFLKEIVQVFQGTKTGNEIIGKISNVATKATDPIIDNALDKAFIKLKPMVTMLTVILVALLVSNIILITKK